MSGECTGRAAVLIKTTTVLVRADAVEVVWRLLPNDSSLTADLSGASHWFFRQSIVQQFAAISEMMATILTKADHYLKIALMLWKSSSATLHFLTLRASDYVFGTRLHAPQLIQHHAKGFQTR